MARPRPSLSIDLPPGFDFPSIDGTLPMTPEQMEERQPTMEPPPPPRQKYTIKRRRPEIIPFEPILLGDSDTIIPTIEMSESLSESSSPLLSSQIPNNSLLSPLPVFPRLATPKTPMPRMQTRDQNDSPSHEWDLINDSRDSKRPTLQRSSSVCSSFSDSSISSGGSSGFSAPNENCTSPESVATDPFTEDDISKADKLVLSPPEQSSSPSAKRVKRHRHVRWTPEMDQHLENTYIRYLSDPRVTPFKTLPGVPPPLGVCNRVAVKARHTWNQHRSATPSTLDIILETVKSEREGSPDTIRPDSSGRHVNEAAKQPQWPRSAATRKRLRKLVKGKPALSAHYQRLLRTRSPSPFASTSSANRSSEPPASASRDVSSFSSRDLKVSLVTSTAPSMQPEGPLAQLASDDTTPIQESRPQSQGSARPVDWFARIGRSHAHQKSMSLQSTLSIGLDTDFTHASAPLASPFDDASTRSHLLQSMTATQSLGRSEFSNRNGKRPSLDAPFEVQGAPTMPRSLKRRFKSDEEKPRRPVLASVFTAPADEGGIVRNRGFTVGAVRANDNLARLFEPPAIHASPVAPPADQEMTEAAAEPETTEQETPDPSFLGPIGSRSAPRRLAEPVPRLGSPFMEAPLIGRQFNTFPRSYIPTVGNPNPFQQRLRELAVDGHQPPADHGDSDDPF